MGDLIGLISVVLIFGTPFFAIYLRHQRKMAEIRSGGLGGANAVEELKDIKRQIAELRDTTTRYDMSFDTALQRIDSRMTHVEQRVSGIEQAKENTNQIS